MAFIKHMLGIADTEADARDRLEIEEAKGALNTEFGYYRQALTRVDVRSRNLIRTWESANDMLNGDRE